MLTSSRHSLFAVTDKMIEHSYTTAEASFDSLNEITLDFNLLSNARRTAELRGRGIQFLFANQGFRLIAYARELIASIQDNYEYFQLYTKDENARKLVAAKLTGLKSINIYFQSLHCPFRSILSPESFHHMFARLRHELMQLYDDIIHCTHNPEIIIICQRGKKSVRQINPDECLRKYKGEITLKKMEDLGQNLISKLEIMQANLLRSTEDSNSVPVMRRRIST
jgi:hypothetical protein